MTKYFKTMREALEEARQFRDPKVDLKVVKNDKVIVIDKSDWPTYKAKGWLQAEEVQVNEARYEVEGTTGYKGISSEDNFHMVINANSEKDAEDKAIDELEKARKQRKIGPGGGGYLEDTEVTTVTKTNDKLSAPETFRGGN
tara:strand:+ start:327 stop:752 length:426 start_codon:yes stop_codon:yes gene_type:complete